MVLMAATGRPRPGLETLTDSHPPLNQASTPCLGSKLLLAPCLGSSPLPKLHQPSMLATSDHSTVSCVLTPACLWACDSSSRECLASAAPTYLPDSVPGEVFLGAPQPLITFSRIRAISSRPAAACTPTLPFPLQLCSLRACLWL